MKLKQLLANCPVDYQILSDGDFVVSGLFNNANFANKNSIFFGIIGAKHDGANFSQQAIANGAKAIVIDYRSNFAIDQLKNIVVIKSNVRELLDYLLPIFYCDLPVELYAITGTNGKTSVADYFRQLMGLLNKKAASIGTIGIKTNFACNIDFTDCGLTTPDLATLYHNLFLLKQQQVEAVAIETSSIGLHQGRLGKLPFNSGCFTNFSQDHLDYHGSMEAYFASKMILFSTILTKQANSFAILNRDEHKYQQIANICTQNNLSIITYGKHQNSDFRLISFAENIVVWSYLQTTYRHNFVVKGDFQAYNLLAALAMIASKHQLNNISDLDFAKIKAPSGRMQLVASYNSADIFIDFAHSPDGLENALKSARSLVGNDGRLLVLFGCGGNRDTSKRPLMGEVCCRLADVVIVTDDNPRLEQPAEIRSAILLGCQPHKTIEIPDRQTAIYRAVAMLMPKDVLILAGKGHEQYQIIGDKYHHFDEEQLVQNAIAQLS